MVSTCYSIFAGEGRGAIAEVNLYNLLGLDDA